MEKLLGLLLLVACVALGEDSSLLDWEEIARKVNEDPRSTWKATASHKFNDYTQSQLRGNRLGCS